MSEQSQHHSRDFRDKLSLAVVPPGTWYAPRSFHKESGLRTIICPTHISNAASIKILVQCGSMDDPQEYSGLGAIIERLLTNRIVQETPTLAQENAAEISDPRLRQEFLILSANTVGWNASRITATMLGLLQRTDYSSAEIKKAVHDVNMLNKLLANDPATFGLERLQTLLFSGTNTGNPILGNPQGSLLASGNITIDLIRKHISKNFSSDKITVVVVGGIGEEEQKMLIHNVDGQLCEPQGLHTLSLPSAKTDISTHTQIKPGQCEYHTYRNEQRSFSPCVHLGFLTPEIHDPTEHIVYEMLHTGLLHHLNEVQTNCPLPVPASVDISYIGYRERGVLHFKFNSHPVAIQGALDSFTQQISRFQDSLNREFLDKIKTQHLIELLLRLESHEGMAETLITDAFHRRNSVSTAADLFEQVNSVSIDDIRAAAATLFSSQYCSMVALGPEKVLQQAQLCYDRLRAKKA